MRRPGKRQDNPEDRIHKRAVMYSRAKFAAEGHTHPPLFHCPNEGQLPVQYRAKLKAKGLSTGVSDLVFMWSPFGWQTWNTRSPIPGAALEIKAPGNVATPEQSIWLDYFARAGFATAVTIGHEATAQQLLAWAYIRDDQLRQWLRWAKAHDPRAY